MGNSWALEELCFKNYETLLQKVPAHWKKKTRIPERWKRKQYGMLVCYTENQIDP